MIPSNKEEVQSLVESSLPQFVIACNNPHANTVMMLQEAFSGNEIILLGCAVKYAGYCGKTVEVIA